MDLLDRVMPPASDLLDRVDALVSRHGAPPDHPVWALLRRVGSLPGDALTHIAALAPEGIRADARPVAALADDCRAAVAGVPVALTARGVAASAYASRWADVSGQIADDRDGLGGRVTATAGYLEAVAEWATTTRRDLAVELGGCLGSAEAVAVRGATSATIASTDVDHGVVLAGAEIAARVLAEVADAIEAGWQVWQQWADIRAEIPVRASARLTVDLAGHIDVR